MLSGTGMSSIIRNRDWWLMEKYMMKKILTVFILACLSCVAYAQDNVIDEIVWVVGDDAILRSDIESQRLYLQTRGSVLTVTLIACFLNRWRYRSCF